MIQAGSRVEDIKAAQGQVEAAKGRLDQINTMIDELVVKAPRDARVESLDLRPGDIVMPNATTATLLEDDQLFVRIYVPETHIGHIQIGQEVPITVDFARNVIDPATGKVTTVAPMLDLSTFTSSTAFLWAQLAGGTQTEVR